MPCALRVSEGSNGRSTCESRYAKGDGGIEAGSKPDQSGIKGHAHCAQENAAGTQKVEITMSLSNTYDAAARVMHTPTPPEIDPEAPPAPNIDPDPPPAPDDDPGGAPPGAPEGDPPATPPPVHALQRVRH